MPITAVWSTAEMSQLQKQTAYLQINALIELRLGINGATLHNNFKLSDGAERKFNVIPI